MIYFAIYLEKKLIGFITEESQKEFLLECNELTKFYEFIWEFDTPPMLEDIQLDNEKIVILKQK
jgi:hypothetical protein